MMSPPFAFATLIAWVKLVVDKLEPVGSAPKPVRTLKIPDSLLGGALISSGSAQMISSL